MLKGDDVVAWVAEEIGNQIVNRDEALERALDLKRVMNRSCRRIGSWEFSARLFRPLCDQC